jgi:hypothetical protein
MISTFDQSSNQFKSCFSQYIGGSKVFRKVFLPDMLLQIYAWQELTVCWRLSELAMIGCSPDPNKWVLNSFSSAFTRSGLKTIIPFFLDSASLRSVFAQISLFDIFPFLNLLNK